MNASNSRTAIDTLVWLIEEAFDGDPSHSLLANLQDLRAEDWTATASGSGRSVADILEHVGWSKWMYEDYAFGSASIASTDQGVGSLNSLSSMASGSTSM